MTNHKSFGVGNCATLINEMISSFGMTLEEIKQKYNDYSFDIIEHHKSGLVIKSIVVDFCEHQTMMDFTFNPDLQCAYIITGLDTENTLIKFLQYLKWTYPYDYIMCRWFVSDYFISVITAADGEIYLKFHK